MELSTDRARPLVAEFRWLAVGLWPWLWFLVRDRLAIADAVAIIAPALAVALLLATAAIAWRRRSAASMLAVVSVAVFVALVLLGPGRQQPSAAPVDPIRIMGVNLESYWFSDNDFDWHLRQNETDLLVTSEIQLSHDNEIREHLPFAVTRIIPEVPNRPIPEPSDTTYTRFGFPSIAVYSRFPVTELSDPTEIEGGLPGIRARVELPTGDVIVYALHVPKPSFGDGLYQVGFGDHRRMAEQIADAVRQESEPTFIIGDLNMTDRGGSYRTLVDAGMRDAMRIERARSTSDKGIPWDLLMLRIDHILIPGDFCGADPEVQRVAFTDHKVISVLAGPCP